MGVGEGKCLEYASRIFKIYPKLYEGLTLQTRDHKSPLQFLYVPPWERLQKACSRVDYILLSLFYSGLPLMQQDLAY